jgi:RNA polymerase sigma-70 factor, ECF subfamily
MGSDEARQGEPISAWHRIHVSAREIAGRRLTKRTTISSLNPTCIFSPSATARRCAPLSMRLAPAPPRAIWPILNQGSAIPERPENTGDSLCQWQISLGICFGGRAVPGKLNGNSGSAKPITIWRPLKQPGINAQAKGPGSGSAPSSDEDEPCLQAYQRELTYILRTLERLGIDLNDLEDLAQEVFLVLRRTWKIYDQTRALKPYLFGIVFRVASMHKRHRRREVPFEFVESTDPAPLPDREFEASQARAMVLEALQEIPLPRRAVLVMHDLDHVSVRDVATALSIPRFTAYSRLSKARTELGSALMRMLARGRSNH